MGETKKILVAIGFYEYAQGTFNCGARLAEMMGAELIIMNVINLRDVEAIEKIADMGYDMDPRVYIDGLKDERQKNLDAIVAASPHAVKNLRAVFRVGDPIDELLKFIVRENVDMVVMGIKGRTADLEHLLVGSVAEKLFRRSPVTVVSCREGAAAERLRHRISLD